MFKDLYISRKQPEEEERTIFFEDCRQLLENGYKFKFIIISSYINDLIQLDAFSKNSVEKAKKAFQFLLPYGLNLCRYPEQREYRLIKVKIRLYIAFVTAFTYSKALNLWSVRFMCFLYIRLQHASILQLSKVIKCHIRASKY